MAMHRRGSREAAAQVAENGWSDFRIRHRLKRDLLPKRQEGLAGHRWETDPHGYPGVEGPVQLVPMATPSKKMGIQEDGPPQGP